MTGTTGRAAPTDPDAQVPGHLPDELPKSAALEDDPLDEEAWAPGRWYPNQGEPLTGAEAEGLGDPIGMPGGNDDDLDEGSGGLDETDARIEGDDLIDGDLAVDDAHDGMKVASHLRNPEEQLTLGDPPDQQGESLVRDTEELAEEVRRFFRGLRVGRQVARLVEEPAAGSLSDPVGAKGFYSDFDMSRDHGDVAQAQGAWYRSPGRSPGGDGDPFRGPDPYSQLGFHPPAGERTPDNSPPATMGQTGAQARSAPPIWQLSAGGDTSKALGANARGEGVGSTGDEQEAGEETGEAGTGTNGPEQPAGAQGEGEGDEQE